MVVKRPYCTDLWKSLFWVSDLNTRAQTRTNWTVRSHMAPTKPTAVRAVYQMKEEIKKCLRTWMHQLLHYSNFLSVWCVQVLTRQLVLYQIVLIFFFFFISLFQWWTVKRLCFLLYASKLHKDVFDLRNQICVSSIVSISDCGNLKVRSERPFDNYRKTFWLYYTAFHLLSGRG